MPTSGFFFFFLFMAVLAVGSVGRSTFASDTDLCAQLTGCPSVRSEIQARAAGGGSLVGLGPWTIGIPAGFPEGGTLTMLPEEAFRVRRLDRNLFQVSLVNEAALFRMVFGSRTLVPIGARYEVSGTGGSIGGGVTACELRVNFVTNAGDAIDPTLIPGELIRLSFQPAEAARLVRVTRDGFIIQRNPGYETTSVRAALNPITDPVSGIRLEFAPQSLPFCGVAPQPAPQHLNPHRNRHPLRHPARVNPCHGPTTTQCLKSEPALIWGRPEMAGPRPTR